MFNVFPSENNREVENHESQVESTYKYRFHLPELIRPTYPTVVMVIKAHQNPSKAPWMNGFGNCLAFTERSCNKTSMII